MNSVDFDSPEWIPPNPLRFNMSGIETRYVEGRKGQASTYLVRIPRSGSLWMDVGQALRGGMVPMPPELPGSQTTAYRSEFFNMAEEDKRIARIFSATKSKAP
jgi:hypothetical protein